MTGTNCDSVEENAASVFFTNATDLKQSSDEITYNSNVTKYIYSTTGQKLRTK